MSLIKEFREFAMRGNVVDLAVGVVIGGAFGKIVSSLVATLSCCHRQRGECQAGRRMENRPDQARCLCAIYC